MFEYNQFIGANKYRVVIKEKPSASSSNKEIIATSISLAVLVTDGLQFGRSYTWHYEAYNNKQLLFTSDSFVFNIRHSYLIDSSMFRYKATLYDKNQSSDNLIFVENLGVAINRDGKPVWFLPYYSAESPEPKYRNLSMTENGTVTFFQGDGCYEKKINGNSVWTTPDTGWVSGEKSDHYHHDFAKMKDGTYITCGYKYVNEPNPLNPALICRVRCNTLIQYDADGNAIWWWIDKDHFSKQTIFEGITEKDIETAGTHMNSFFYDEENDAFLLSFRNLSRIIKIDKKTGNVIYQFGSKLPNDPTVLNETDAFFSKQHGPTLLPDKNILFYNNNVDEEEKKMPTYPHVVIMSQPLNNKPGKVIWDYECATAQYPKGLRSKEGYAINLPNQNILVCMGGENRTFEITRAKKIVWECFFEKYNAADSQWIPFTNYRSRFASSLYPQYFTVSRLSKSTVINQEQLFNELTIHNDGTDDDIYKVVLSSSKGTVLKKEILVSIKSGLSEKVRLKLQKATSSTVSNDELSIAIFPANNPINSRVFTFQLK